MHERSIYTTIIWVFLALATVTATVVAAAVPSYPINTTVSTTADRTIEIVPVPSDSPNLTRPDDVANYTAYKYDGWYYGSGLASVLL